MIKVAFFSSKPYVEDSFNALNTNNKFSFTFFDCAVTKENAELCKNFDVVCFFVNDEVTEEVVTIIKNSGCKLIAMRCAGYNNVSLETAKKLNLPIVRVPEYSPYGVAEHAMGMILTLNRKIHKAHNRVKELNFNIDGLLGFDLHGKTIGVIGTGKIGKVFLKICTGFGLNIIAYDPYPDHEAAKNIGFKYVDLEEIYKQSDIISLWCPLNPQTHHIINDASINKMKDGVFLVNTSRGGLVNAKDAIKHLKNGKISALALDVYEEEANVFFEDLSKKPLLQDDVLSLLLGFNNVLITSHQAFFTNEAVNKIAEVTLNNIENYILNGKLQNQV